MKCDICESTIKEGFITAGGNVCSEDCRQIIAGRIKAYHDELHKEPLGQMPDNFSTGDFERWTLKFAVHWLRGLSDEERAEVKRKNPLLLVPDQLALDFKERIISRLPSRYVSSVENRGHSRLFSGGTYCFRQVVPAQAIIEAARRAQLINA
jgi:hypothetical protein